MANKAKDLNSIRKFVYYATVILSLSTLWISKLVNTESDCRCSEGIRTNKNLYKA